MRNWPKEAGAQNCEARNTNRIQGSVAGRVRDCGVSPGDCGVRGLWGQSAHSCNSDFNRDRTRSRGARYALTARWILLRLPISSFALTHSSLTTLRLLTHHATACFTGSVCLRLHNSLTVTPNRDAASRRSPRHIT